MYGHFSALQIETKQQLTQQKECALQTLWGGEKIYKVQLFPEKKKKKIYICTCSVGYCVCQVGTHAGLYSSRRGGGMSPPGTQIIDLYLCF